MRGKSRIAFIGKSPSPARLRCASPGDLSPHAGRGEAFVMPNTLIIQDNFAHASPSRGPHAVRDFGERGPLKREGTLTRRANQARSGECPGGGAACSRRREASYRYAASVNRDLFKERLAQGGGPRISSAPLARCATSGERAKVTDEVRAVLVRFAHSDRLVRRNERRISPAGD